MIQLQLTVEGTSVEGTSMDVDKQREVASLTEEEIAEISKRCDRATTGPWRSYDEARDQISGSSFIMTAAEDIYLTGATLADQDFIAHARQDIPRMVAEIKRLKGLLSP